jgi:hypothetical protein
MANHLTLKEYLLERGADGGLALKRSGQSLAFTAEEVRRLVAWLGDTQRESRLVLGQKRWREGTLGFRVREGSTLFLLFSSDVGLIYHWLKARKG